VSAGTGVVPEHAVDGPLPGPGRHLVEASAGTGKTFTLAALATRLVAEGVATIDQLLVVTFTRAAAAELRDRIRRRLTGTVSALDDLAFDPDDPVHRRLADGADDEVRRRRDRLARAVAEFDTATITTIHGFCQQVLQSLGATSGHNPDAVLVQDIDDLVHGACADVLATAALDEGAPFMPHQLVGLVHTVLNNPGVRVVAGSGHPDDDARRELVERAVAEVRDRLGSTGTLSYDGMLEAVRDALVAHPDAAARVAQQFPVALVDEFQDTDPVQWQILRAVYSPDDDGTSRPGTRLVLVGDPKQAIYAFRGGDIHTYLAAAEGSARSTLGVNRRTDGALLDALNALCDGWTLGDDRIRYLPVRPADANAARRLVGPDGRPVPALQVRCAARRLDQTTTKNGASRIGADPARWACTDDVVRAIVELLDDGTRVPCPDDHPEAEGPEGARTRPLRPSDVAVLVHANSWSHPVQRALVRHGVPAVVTGGSSVAESPAADQWRILLDALARPSDPTRARAVALSWFGDRDPERVAASADDDVDDRGLAELQAQLDAWSALLRTEGVAALLSVLRADVRLAARVLAQPDGERDLTDLEHLGELLHGATAGRPIGPESLRALLDEMAHGADADDPEEIKRRIDSDAPAVRIMTLHAAKGLEFPVVCCPSLWNLSVRVDQRLHHDPRLGRLLDVSTDSKAVPDVHEAARREIAGQHQRLVYVGMTRAVHRLVLWWCPARDAAKTPVARLLFGPDGPSKVVDDHPDQLRERLDGLGLADGVVELVEVPPHGSPIPRHRPVDRPEADAVGSLGVASLGRVLDRSGGRWSFTAIASRAIEHEPAAADTAVPAPANGDPDDPSLGDAADADEGVPAPPVLFDGLGAGAAFGTLVHDALEHLDFTGDLEAQLTELLATRPWAGDADRRAGLVRAIAATVRTPLGDPFGDVALSSIERAHRLDELEFELPLATAGRGADDRGATVDTAGVGAVLLRHLPSEDPLRPWAERVVDGTIRVEVGGFLTGSIDLVLRTPADVPGGHRYSVVDYKTNRLGSWAEPDRISNYRPDLLAAAMAHHHYPLQAALYSVALHRYLRWRLPSYRPEQHLGPVGYLFVRGMVGDVTPVAGGRRYGVFDWSVPSAAVVELSELLDGAAPELGVAS
jgi:exodeoxyribonuclease V beta subunit